MYIAKRLLCVGLLVAGLACLAPAEASAQYPVVVQPAVPAVVGYTAERRGLLGLRVVYRPVVSPVAAAVPAAPVTVARPVLAAPAITVARPAWAAPAVTVARPAWVVPAPVTRYYAPPAPVAVPTYRVPVTSYRIPVFAF